MGDVGKPNALFVIVPSEADAVGAQPYAIYNPVPL
jgi:hypothetical protein